MFQSVVQLTQRVYHKIYYQRIMQAQKFKTQIQYLLVLDFQATCQKDVKLEPCSEIIQFPIIVVSTRNGSKLDVFHQYVKPRYHPKLTPFCTQLTGITQQMVDGGKYIQQVVLDLDKWIKSLPYLKQDNYTFVTCGDWDLATCLKHEARAKKLLLNSYLRSYINIKKYFVKVLENKFAASGMMQMINVLNLKHEGRHHSGIDDVSNICNICIALIQKHGATFPKQQINKLKYFVQKEGFRAELQYLLVLDFEATCEQNKKLAPCSEIIQFPVIVVETSTGKRLETFHQYVKPTINPQLTNFCTNLTGIRQDQVNAGKSIEQVIIDFDKWINSLDYLNEDNFAFVTCGDWDLANCLKNEAICKKIEIKPYLKSYINIKKYFSKVMKNNRQKLLDLMGMLEFLKIKHEGKHHSGIDDVLNICNICVDLITNQKAAFPKKEIIHLKY